MLEMVKSKRDGNAMLAARNSSVYQGCYYVAYTFRSIDLFLQSVFFICVCVLSLALLCFGHFQAKPSSVRPVWQGQHSFIHSLYSRAS